MYSICLASSWVACANGTSKCLSTSETKKISNLTVGCFWLSSSFWPWSLSSLRRGLEVQAPKWCRQSGTDPLLRPLDDTNIQTCSTSGWNHEKLCFTMSIMSLLVAVNTKKWEDLPKSSKSHGTSPCHSLRLLQEVSTWCQHYPAPSVWSDDTADLSHWDDCSFGFYTRYAVDISRYAVNDTKTRSGLRMYHRPNMPINM